MSQDPSLRLDFRDVVGAFATGVTVVTSRVGDSLAGMTLNSFTSVSLDPLLVLVSLAHGTRTLEMIRRSNRYAVNVLHRRQRDVALDFAKRGAPFPPGHTIVDPAGYVAVRHALAILRCEVTDVHLAGDHDLVIGEVVDFAKRGAPFPPGHTIVDPAGYVAVRHALAILRCEVTDVHLAGDHDLVIGEVVDFEGSGGEPLIFHRGAFGGLDEDALVPSGRVIGIAGSGW